MPVYRSFSLLPDSLMYPCSMPTNRAPPAMLPNVAGARLHHSSWTMSTSAPSSIPQGMKNMFATQCSYPSITKAATGIQHPTTFSVSVCPDSASHTARHTHQLAPMPRSSTVVHGRFAFVSAVRIMAV